MQHSEFHKSSKIKAQEVTENDPFAALDMGREFSYTDKAEQNKGDIAEIGEETSPKELVDTEKAKRKDSMELERKYSDFDERHVNQADFHLTEGKNLYHTSNID